MRKTNKLDAVLPLLLRDCERAELLFRSLDCHFSALNTCWIVARDNEAAEIRARLRRPDCEVIKESDLIPELPAYRWLAKKFGRSITGWFVQQIIKFAIAERATTEFFLTLDADVLCLRPTSFPDLVRDGRAIAQLLDQDLHPDWYRRAEKLLGCKRPPNTHGVTPAIFSRTAVLELQEYLSGRIALPLRAAGTLPRGELCASWRSYLIRSIPWTEYSLYHTFLHHRRKFDLFHFDGGPCALYDNKRCLWTQDRSETWTFDPNLEGNARFIIVQSATSYPVETIRKLVEPYLNGSFHS